MVNRVGFRALRAAVIVSCVLVAILAYGRAFAATILNGSFEDGANKPPAGSFAGKGSGNTDITGWTIGGSGIDWVGNSYWEAADGQLSIDLSAGAAGSLSQSVLGLEIGKLYRISFSLAGNVDGGPTLKQMNALIDGNSFGFSFDTTGKSRPTGMGWEQRNFDFIYAGNDPILTFANPINTAYGPAIDDVSIGEVTGIPEPATLALFGVGIAAMGLLGWRTRRMATPGA